MAEVKNIQHIDVNSLIPYENNSKKHPEKQLDLLCKSIEEFGFISPVLIDNKNRIIAGHGRVEAAKRLRIQKVPCLFIEGLTEEQRKAYIIADNRLTEMGGWDKELLVSELQLLDACSFDIELTGFTDDFIESMELSIIDQKSNERERTDKAYNLDLAHDSEMTNDFWQMPVLYAEDYVPSDLISFNYAKTSKNKNCGIHFFIDDYQFERIWNYPEKYVSILNDYECIFTPDFSLYTDMPMPMKIWNIYRSRQIGAYYQGCGLKVIPTVSWAEKETFQFCFEGIQPGGTVAVSTIGVHKNKEALEIWQEGMAAMIDKVHPKTVILYGDNIDFDFGEIKVVHFKNTVTGKLRTN